LKLSGDSIHLKLRTGKEDIHSRRTEPRVGGHLDAGRGVNAYGSLKRDEGHDELSKPIEGERDG